MALIDISRLRIDGGTQHRAKQNEDAIADYTDAYLDGKKMPPVAAVHDGANYWLWEGFHRVAAAKLAGMKGIAVELTKGTQRDAFRLSLQANATNGMRRSNDDKRNAVIAALHDAEFSALSDREVAGLCGVSNHLVASLRPAKQADKAEPTKTLLAVENGNSPTLELSGYTSSAPENAELKKRGRPSKQVAKPEVDATETADPDPPPPPPPKPRVVPLGSLEDITRERDELRDKVIELGEICQDLTDEVAALLAVTSADDQVTAALEECRKERGRRIVAEERVNGLMNEKNAAVRAANGWMKKARVVR